MAKNSQIEWTHHTFNPWWGCSKVSPACENCYADLWARRMGHDLWGTRAPRRTFTDAHWKEPATWNQEARESRERKRVFCASMADVFEDRAVLQPHRERLWNLIEATTNLDWLLLTKRPENVARMVPWKKLWPRNVWLGTSVENQEYAERRLPHLLAQPAAIRFLSCEPLLGYLDLKKWFKRPSLHPIDWIIAGGESGPNARPMHPDWATGLRDQCQTNGVPFHFKQWGHWVPEEMASAETRRSRIEIGTERRITMVRLPKKDAGRLLGGKTWDGLPKSPALSYA